MAPYLETWRTPRSMLMNVMPTSWIRCLLDAGPGAGASDADLVETAGVAQGDCGLSVRAANRTPSWTMAPQPASRSGIVTMLQLCKESHAVSASVNPRLVVHRQRLQITMR